MATRRISSTVRKRPRDASRLRSSCDAIEKPDRELPTDHRGQLQRRSRFLGETINPSQDDVVHRRRGRHVGQRHIRCDLARRRVDHTGPGQRLRELLDKQRIPAGPLDDERPDRRRQRVGADAGCGEAGRVVLAERLEDQAGQAVTGIVQTLATRSGGEQHQHRRRETIQQEREHHGERVVDPVDVLDRPDQQPASLHIQHELEKVNDQLLETLRCPHRSTPGRRGPPETGPPGRDGCGPRAIPSTERRADR